MEDILYAYLNRPDFSSVFLDCIQRIQQHFKHRQLFVLRRDTKSSLSRDCCFVYKQLCPLKYLEIKLPQVWAYVGPQFGESCCLPQFHHMGLFQPNRHFIYVFSSA
uniref:Uncharacterized protein n=1 Tax=Micrurus lemniscatus lemniscatus TaxID=129467 RepID=A0A2D4HHD1_MICLE